MTNNKTFQALVAIRAIVAFIPVVNLYAPVAINFLTFIFLYLIVLTARYGGKQLLGFLPIFLIDLMNMVFSSIYGLEHHVVNELYAITRPLLWAMVSWYVISFCNRGTAKTIFLTIIGCYCITLISTCVGCVIFPNAARLMATGMEDDQFLYRTFQMYNIGGFYFVYTITLMVPLLIYHYKENMCGTTSFLIMLFSIVLLTVITEYTMALLGVVLTIILLLFIKNVTVGKLLKYFVIGVLIILTMGSYIAMLLEWVGNFIGSEQISTRFNELSLALSNNLSNDDTDLEDRMERWKISIDTFKESPVYGSNGARGGHSYVLDNMAKFGSIGIVALYVLYKCIYKNFIESTKLKKIYPYAMVTIMLQAYYAILNPKFFIEFFVLILPLYIYIYTYESSLDNKHTIA